MRRINLYGHKLDIYDSIDDMPVVRFHKFNRYLLVDSGIGATVSDVDKHLSRTIEFLHQGDNVNAVKELENLRQGIHLVEQGISPKGYAFAVLVKAIDGKDLDDISDDGLKAVMDKLPNMTIKELSSLIEESKKKIDTELRLYFPSLFDDSQTKEYYNKLKRRAMLQLENITEIIEEMEKHSDSAIKKISSEIITFSKPKQFGGKQGIEISYDKEFESSCIVIGSELHLDAKGMTVMAYYQALEFLHDRSMKMQQKIK